MCKNIVVCADGTWNRPSAQTNVWQLFCALPGSPNNVKGTSEIGHFIYRDGPATAAQPQQLAFYLQGVGTKFSRSNPLSGALGTGLHDKVLDGYILVSRAYVPGDKIYLFGFSRGAYTARSLGGLIAAAGLMPAHQAASPGCRRIANDIWWDFKKQRLAPHPTAPDANAPQPITLVGVWDTVGALGIPFFNGIHLIDALEAQLFDFADSSLSPRVASGRHAVAVDEKREDFLPTLWNPRAGVAECWFAGVHSDVGGGYPSRGLADIALDWMLDEAATLGLVLKTRPATAPDPQADRHESCVDLWKLRDAQRQIPPTAVLHPSVLTRLQQRADYRPAPLGTHPACAPFYGAAAPAEKICTMDPTSPNQSLAPGTAIAVTVMAEKWWNAAGIVVAKGERYVIQVDGTWNDDDILCNADGWTGWGLLKRLRRLPSHNWFHLCLAVSPKPALELKNASLFKGLFGAVKEQDVVSALIPIGTGCEVVMPMDGYLYFFANDAPAHYGNNTGCLDVTITRV